MTFEAGQTSRGSHIRLDPKDARRAAVFLLQTHAELHLACCHVASALFCGRFKSII